MVEESDKAAEQVAANGDSGVGGGAATAVETAQAADEASNDNLEADDSPEEDWPGTVVCFWFLLLGHHVEHCTCSRPMSWPKCQLRSFIKRPTVYAILQFLGRWLLQTRPAIRFQIHGRSARGSDPRSCATQTTAWTSSRR